jgi:hypothetical protein
MPGTPKHVEFFERGGKVYRRVTLDLVGVKVITAEYEISDNPVEYQKQLGKIKILGYDGSAVSAVRDPTNLAIHALGSYLDSVDSIDLLLRMRKLDPRKGALPLYEERLHALLDASA